MTNDSDDMIERVALAIEGTMFAPHELPLSDELHGKYRMAAAAVISAMRQPTHAMIDAAIFGDRQWSMNAITRVRAAWARMIDAALSPRS